MTFEYNSPTSENIAEAHYTLDEAKALDHSAWDDIFGSSVLKTALLGRYGMRYVRMTKDTPDFSEKFAKLVRAFFYVYGRFFTDISDGSKKILTAMYTGKHTSTNTTYAAPDGQPSGFVVGQNVTTEEGVAVGDAAAVAELLRFEPAIAHAMREFERMVLLEVLA